MNSNIDLSKINHIFDFDYFETYSLQRGLEYEEMIIKKEKSYEEVVEKDKFNLLGREEIQNLNILENQLNNVQLLFDDSENLHFSALKIKILYSTEDDAKQLINLFKIKTEKIPSWMCAPIYRDAIVFYNKEDAIIEVLNICFSCEFIQNSNKTFVDADKSFY